MSGMMSAAQKKRAQSGDAILRFSDGVKATEADFATQKPVVLFIHGFTADASYMRELMHQFDGSGFASFAFEYASYCGIDHAARSLVSLLTLFDRKGTISSSKIVLVGHSMGGLVARAAVGLFGGETFVRKVVTLGTPNDGTLQGHRIPRYMAYWGEAVGNANPRGFDVKGESARQLIKADPSPTFLDRLQAVPAPSGVHYYSISGGKTQLDFGKGYLKNRYINRYLQKRLEFLNDGLVSESSSDLSRPCFSVCAPGCTHKNSYVAFPDSNHTFLTENHEVAQTAIDCIR
ncbi:alpha/beta fold hydrolase [Variovorax sp. Sphag1AA]|uniref:alpha/beta fold hydrolase n=1 Tax=Variovorax sp. Sphag1AA TaxID=2587027 RepID=UPI001611D5E0|nr:alpha/beta fold hydrolase [Variovorax sp. Sphag1AA]MBB3180985.1 pimeloyl-ACP methyl ester carboxylesterase [Variovorax sp. Sphag1AA]